MPIWACSDSYRRIFNHENLTALGHYYIFYASFHGRYTLLHSIGGFEYWRKSEMSSDTSGF